MSPNLPYLLFYYISSQIFRLEPKFFGEIEGVPGARSEVWVPKDCSSQQDSLNHTDRLWVQ